MPNGITGPGSGSSEAEELGEWVERHGLGDALAFWARQQCDDAPVEWVKALFRRKVIGQPAKPFSQASAYLSTILAHWIAKGECEYLASRREAATEPGRINLKSWTPEQRPMVIAAVEAALARNIGGPALGGKGARRA